MISNCVFELEQIFPDQLDFISIPEGKKTPLKSLRINSSLLSFAAEVQKIR